MLVNADRTQTTANLMQFADQRKENDYRQNATFKGVTG